MDIKVVKIPIFCSLSNYLGSIPYSTQGQEVLDSRVHVEHEVITWRGNSFSSGGDAWNSTV